MMDVNMVTAEEVSTILVKIKGTREEGAHALGVCPVDATMPQIIR
jgi:hypothetical protein